MTYYWAASQQWLASCGLVAYCCRRSSVVCLCVCLLITFVSPAKTDKRIEMPFEWVNQVGPLNQVLDGVQISKGRSNFGG